MIQFQCWQCGKPFPIGQVRRRNVITGDGAAWGSSGAYGYWTATQRVDLCPACDEKGRRQNAHAMDAIARVALTFAAVIASLCVAALAALALWLLAGAVNR